MSKMLETVMDIVRDVAKTYLPPLFSVIKRGLDLKTFSMSMMAHYSRRFGARAILTVGVLATVYASYLFMVNLERSSHVLYLLLG